MIIKKVILNNIKSYVHEEIDFSQGINCILGLNGSGKSTIIESIGLALFNFFKTKTTAQMLRYDETRGSIEVEFVANDERLYRVVRTIRPKASTVKIIDCATNSELYTGVGDVYGFIKNVLKVSKTKEFSKMFEEIIAVPQGQYVSAFLEKPAERKENFDKLFDLHIYKDLGFKIKDLSDNIKNNKIKELEKEIENIDGQLINYENKKKQLKKVNDEIVKLEEDKVELDSQYNNISEEKTNLEVLKKDIEVTKTDHALNDGKITNYEIIIKKNNEELVIANYASEVVHKNFSSYMKYQNNLDEIRNIEAQYERFLIDENKVKEYKNLSEIIKINIQNFEQNSDEKITEINVKNNTINSINSEIILSKIKYNLEDEKFNLEQQNYDQKIAKNIEIKQEFLDQFSDLKLFKSRYENIEIFDENLLEINQKKIEENEEKANQIEQINYEINELEKEKIIIETQYQNHYKNSLLTIDGTCPFLKTKCKNIDEGSLANYFEKQMQHSKKILDDLNTKIESILKDLPDKNEVIIELQNLNDVNRRHRDGLNKILLLENEFTNKYVDELNEIESFTFLQKIEYLINSVNFKLDDIKKSEEELAKENKKLINHQTEVSSMNYKIHMDEKKVLDCEKEIKDLQKLVDDLSKKKTIETHKLEANEKEIVKLTKTLEGSTNLKQTLDTLKKANLDLQASSNSYLANLEKSKDLDNIKTVLKDNSDELERLKNKSLDLKKKIEKLAVLYSEERHKEVNDIYQKLIKEISAVATSIKEKTNVSLEISNEILIMDNLIIIRKEKQMSLEKYKSIVDFLAKTRTIFTTLPLELSKTYREYISHASTKIYRDISHEGVRIEILEDYQVQIIDDIVQTNTKCMEQLSGGEQMSVALAIRLSMLKHLSGLDIYFLDEPTINLDYERRERIAEVVRDISGELTQLFVISHDDTFDSITDSVIKIQKNENCSNIV